MIVVPRTRVAAALGLAIAAVAVAAIAVALGSTPAYIHDIADAATVSGVVEGEVTEAGVYPLIGPSTLLGTIALAKGETRVSALNNVVIFRTIGGRRMAAVFDIRRIRDGLDPDPQVYGNDVVVVGYSSRRGLWRDVLQTAP